MIKKIELFKALLLILIIGFLYVFYDYSKSVRKQSENGRYILVTTTYSSGQVIDTRTGKVYENENGSYEAIKKDILA